MLNLTVTVTLSIEISCDDFFLELCADVLVVGGGVG